METSTILEKFLMRHQIEMTSLPISNQYRSLWINCHCKLSLNCNLMKAYNSGKGIMASFERPKKLASFTIRDDNKMPNPDVWMSLIKEVLRYGWSTYHWFHKILNLSRYHNNNFSIFTAKKQINSLQILRVGLKNYYRIIFIQKKKVTNMIPIIL